MDKNSRIFIADHECSHGSAIKKKLEAEGYSNLILKKRSELDLKNQNEVIGFLKYVKPEYVFLAAGKSGGIMANKTHPADFLLENLEFQISVIPAAAKSGVKKLLFLGSSCIYPKDANQPIQENSLFKGDLEETSEATSIAKIAGYGLARAYSKQFGIKCITAIPATTYGPGSNFNPEDAHVLSALMTKFYESKKKNDPEVVLWGTGRPLREFIYLDDFAEACIFLMKNYDDLDLINIGSGSEVSIRDLASTIKDIVGYEGEIKFDESKPDGAMRKILSSDKINRLGWKSYTNYKDGLQKTYAWYHKNYG